MKRHFLVLSTWLLVFTGSNTPACAQSFFGRSTVLESPIRFKDGFSFTNDFTVGKATKYDLALRFRKHTELRPGPPPDDFTVEFKITDGTSIIAQGNNDTFYQRYESWHPRHPALLQRDYTTRFLCTFDAEPRKLYHLFLLVVRATPALASTSPVVIVTLNQGILK